MINTKRKWEDVDVDSDDDEPSFGKQTLPVANLPMDFDRQPEDGMEYLFMVRRDARRLPFVTRVSNPYEVLEPVPTIHPAQRAGNACINLPSQLWRCTFLSRFRNLRKNITQPTIHVDIDIGGSRKVMPDKKERDLWWKFLDGLPESEWNPPKKKPKKPSLKKSRFSDYRQASCDELEVGHDTNDEQNHVEIHETWRINSEGDIELAEDKAADTSPSGAESLSNGSAFFVSAETTSRSMGPLSTGSRPDDPCNPREIAPSLLRKIDHNMSLHLLMYFVHWMNNHLQDPADSTFMILESHARWMFALLAKVEDFISADDMSQLRSLARACLELVDRRRKGGEAEGHVADELALKMSMTETSCWMIFTAVSGIWGQSDLWEDAETLLA